MSKKWRVVLMIALAELLAMGLWFSASAVTPSLIEAWQMSDGQVAWLTMAVQIGFVAGAVSSALLNVADVWPPRRVFALGAVAGALFNALIPLLVDGVAPALLLRFLTGFTLAAVYPVGMKIMATWMKADRGLGLGMLVGALTLGSATPHLSRALGGVTAWEPVLLAASALALLGGIIAWFAGDLGPHRSTTPPFNWRYAIDALRDRGVRLANVGYLGHMWELYAMWTWIPLFLLESFAAAGLGDGAPRAAALAAFAVIGSGSLGSLTFGRLADGWGRTRTTILSMAVSGTIAATIGTTFGAAPAVVTLLALVWGVTIVADSAQFSAAVSELADRRYMGTALTLQTAMGFTLTLVSIRLIPLLVNWVGWAWAFAFLAPGPLVGSWAMLTLRRLPQATQLAGGRR